MYLGAESLTFHSTGTAVSEANSHLHNLYPHKILTVWEWPSWTTCCSTIIMKIPLLTNTDAVCEDSDSGVAI